MPTDPSIILGINQPDAVGAISKGLQAQNSILQNQNLAMANQKARQDFQDNQLMQQAQDANTHVDQDGNLSYDKEGILKSLASSSRPSLAMKAQQQFAQSDADKVELGLKKSSQAAQMIQGVNDEASYQKVKNSPLAKMSGSDNWPPNYDPAFKESLHGQALNNVQYFQEQKDKQDLQIKQQEAQNKATELKIEAQKAFGSGGMAGQDSGSGAGYIPPGYVPPKNGIPGQLSKVDPADLINRVPQDQKSAAQKEIQKAQDKAAVVPLLAESQNKLIAAMQNNDPAEFSRESDKYDALFHAAYKAEENTPGKLAMVEALRDSTKPNWKTYLNGGFDQKREALQGWATTADSAPVSQKYFGGLDKYESTKVDQNVFNGSKSPLIQQSQKNFIHPALQGLNKQQLLDLKAKLEQVNAK